MSIADHGSEGVKQPSRGEVEDEDTSSANTEEADPSAVASIARSRRAEARIESVGLSGGFRQFIREPPSNWLVQVFFSELLTAIIVGLVFFAVTEYQESARQRRAEQLENLRFVRSAVANPMTANSRKFQELDLAGTALGGLDLADADLRRADLSGANLAFAKLGGAILIGADLTDADLSFATLTGASLGMADLTGASLMLADLTDADLTNADLTNANLSPAILSGANLTGAKLTGADLDAADLIGVRYDCFGGATTDWPDGVEPPESAPC